MNPAMRRGCMVGALALMCVPAQDAHAQTPTARIVRNANAFLSTLNDAQRQRVLFDFDDDAQRVRWSNFPIAMVKRSGLSMGELNEAQRTAALALVVSAAEQRSNAERVLDIVIDVDAVAPRDGGDRRLTFENRHLRGISVYLVNALVPRDPDIRVTHQNRNYEQSVYQMDYEQSGVLSDVPSASWWTVIRGWPVAAAILTLACLVSMRGRRTTLPNDATSGPSPHPGRGGHAW